MPSIERKEAGMNHLPRRLLTAALALTVGLALAAPPAGQAQTTTPPPFLVSASWVAQLNSNPSIVVVDMRAADAYAQGHIPGAVNLPVQTLAQPDTSDDV